MSWPKGRKLSKEQIEAMTRGRAAARLARQKPRSPDAIPAKRRKRRSKFVGILGQGVLAMRLARGISQVEFAGRIKMHQSQLSRLERGKLDPRLSEARRIACAFNTTIDGLLEKTARVTPELIEELAGLAK